MASPTAKAKTSLTSEAFALAWTQLQKGKGPSQYFRAYVIAIARNLAAKHYRKHHAWIAPEEPQESDSTVESVDPVIDEERAHIAAAFKALPQSWQQVLWLLEVEQFPRKAVAE